MLTALLSVLIATPVPVSTALDALVDAHMTEHHVMGVSVAVLKGGKVVDQSYRGFADQPAGIKVDASTRMRLASISKPVTATMIMQQVANGKIDLDADIRKYVPEWPDKGHKITMRQILTHRSGIRHYLTGKQDAGYDEKTTSQALALFKDDPLLYTPGEKYDYSTHAFTLAAAALENVTGKKMPQLVAELSRKTGGPTLQCENLAMEWPKWRSRHYVVREDKAVPSGRAENLSWKYGGGGMESSAVDLAKFGYSVASSKSLSSKFREMMWTDPEKDGYGLGWNISGDLRQHSGSQQGAQSFLMVDVKNDLVIVVLTNTVPNPPGTLAKKVHEYAAKTY